ncbi:MAG: type II toxin-antitoxin system RelE/ParE family toxin [Proteobacteria bacterium]|nr:type II toxin-antitoxin system RelE/ParE family toxin [Pseudomonadota bacterium]
MIVAVDPAAKAEIREAAFFYEDSRSGLGSEFLNAVELAFTQIKKRPTLWRHFKGSFRRYILAHFPYAVIYTIDNEIIYVAAVMHMKRKPGYWIKRI